MKEDNYVRPDGDKDELYELVLTARFGTSSPNSDSKPVFSKANTA